MLAAGIWRPGRGGNISDSGSHFYDCYECADGRWIAVGPIEEKFFALLLERLGIDAAALGPQMSREHWKPAKAVLAARFKTRPRDEWARLLEQTDACASPVLSFAEAADHPHMKARGTFVEIDGIVQAAPAPRFSRTPPARPTPPQAPDSDSLSGWLPEARIEATRAQGLI
jgi:crotonobetainyl-CoA:carnitine CoA-transferase CaiB-like acyl-CoA transferase